MRIHRATTPDTVGTDSIRRGRGDERAAKSDMNRALGSRASPQPPPP